MQNKRNPENMKNIYSVIRYSLITVASLCTLPLCAQQKSLDRMPRNEDIYVEKATHTSPHPLEQFTLENPLNITREDESLILTRSQLRPVDKHLLPVIVNKQGEYIPCQLDDLNGDGQWDELAFVYSLPPSGRTQLNIKWIAAGKYPVFTARTNVRFGKMTVKGVINELTSDSHGKDNLPRNSYMYPYQMDGPVWENDKMGFRQYFDGRNCCDVFGKRVPEMVMDTVGIGPDRCPANTYQTLREWGCDIMSAANSFGLGGLALQTPDSLIRMGVPAELTRDVIDSTHYALVTEGPVRSILRLIYDGWQVKSNRINLCEEITIWAGKYGFEKKVTTSALPAQSHLVTGIVCNLNTQPFTEEVYEDKQLGMLTHDKQTVNGSYYFGMGLLIPAVNALNTFHAPDAKADIQKTWCVRMKPDAKGNYRYRTYAAWELRDKQFSQREAFTSMLAHEALCINHPVIIHF